MRFIIALILSVFISLPAFAQANNDSFYVMENFSEGMKSHISEYIIKDGTAKDLQNVRINTDFGQLSKRAKRLKVAACHASSVNSLYRYYKSDNEKLTIATTSTYIDAVDDSGTCTVLSDQVSDGKKWSFVTYKDILIGMNGTNNAKKWDGITTSTANTDGAKTANNLLADLGAPFAELHTGANLDASSWYQYKIAYYNGSYYTFSLARSNPILTGSTVRDITLTDIPLGPDGTTARYVYRTLGNASRAAVQADTTFYKIATISNNSTVTINDAMPDDTADNAATPTWATVAAGYEVTPPKAKYCAINQERLFLANDPSGTISGKSTVYYSPVLKQDYFYYWTDYELIRPDDGDEITFIKNLLGTLTIGKTRTISKFYTSGATTSWSVSDPYSFVGCVAPYSAVNGISGIIYLGRYGVYIFSGNSSELISDVVTDRIRDILETSQQDAVGAYHDNTYYLSYTSAESGSSVNDKVLLFNLTRNAYVTDTMKVNSFMALDSGDDAGTLYSGSSDVDGSIYAHSDSYSKLTYRYLSQLGTGTQSNTYISGEENSPLIQLGDNETWDDESGTWDDLTNETWLMDSLTGTWTSPIVQINAAQLDKIFWNESLGTKGNVTFAVRTGSTPGAVAAASWSAEVSSPSGSDISGVTANIYSQIRASLSSTSWTETPVIFTADSFLARMTYKKSGVNIEPSFLSFWKGGLTNMGSELPKRIKEIQVYYTGNAGTLIVAYTSDSGKQRSFNIDLSVSPSASSSDAYFGTNENKVFSYTPDFSDQPISRHWKFEYAENGTEQWKLKRLVARVELTPYVSYQGDL